jgi:FKBP-type peptidyl-prolyl cis-trans isomerase
MNRPLRVDRLCLHLALAAGLGVMSGCPLWNRFSRDIGMESWQVEYRPPVKDPPPAWAQAADESAEGATEEAPVEGAITDEEVIAGEAKRDVPAAAGDEATQAPDTDGGIEGTDVEPSGGSEPAEPAETAPEQVLAFDGARLPVVSSRTLESGLSVDVLRTGGGATCRGSSWVVLRTRGEVADGAVFDPADDGVHGPWLVSQLITGLQQGIIGMTVGGVRRITIPPELAYGEAGVPRPESASESDAEADAPADADASPPTPLIPPGATLVYTVELVDVFATAMQAREAQPAASETDTPEGSE